MFLIHNDVGHLAQIIGLLNCHSIFDFWSWNFLYLVSFEFCCGWLFEYVRGISILWCWLDDIMNSCVYMCNVKS